MAGKHKTNDSTLIENDELQEIESKEKLFIVDSLQGNINLGTLAGCVLFNQDTKGLE